MAAAIGRDGDAQRALLAGDVNVARAAFAEAAELYRRSWEAAQPASYGRLVGMLKSAVLCDEVAGSPPAAPRRARTNAEPSSREHQQPDRVPHDARLAPVPTCQQERLGVSVCGRLRRRAAVFGVCG